jgi:ComF family protein
VSTTGRQGWLDQSLNGRCALCETDLLGVALCSHCQRSLVTVPQPCPVCALPMQAFCSHPRHWQLDALGAPYVYAGNARELIGRLKFDRQRWLGQVLGQLLTRELNVGYDLCVPVPLHRRRLAQRGFNQALEIARGLLPADKPMRLASVVKRVRNTPPQVQLTAAARRQNLIGCFELTAAVEQCRVLLVDDVVTTGSTLSALATLLRGNGACYVGGIAFARAVGPYTANV